MNGAGLIHDVEIAMIGHTSEDVTRNSRGNFWNGKGDPRDDQPRHQLGRERRHGYRRGVGPEVLRGDFPFKELSLLAAGQRLGIPITVHVAIGTDITHMDLRRMGRPSGREVSETFSPLPPCIEVGERGLHHLGSAVILPEVFLKAIGLARNLGHPLVNLTTVNMDFIRHYRPATNVVRRPTLKEGRALP